MKPFLLLSFLALATPAFASAQSEVEHEVASRHSSAYRKCIDASEGSDARVMDCSSQELEEQDAKLNSTYQAIIDRLPKAERNRLQASQRAWIVRQEQQCKSEFPEPMLQWGTLERLGFSMCLVSQTIRRTVWLERYGAGKATLSELSQ